MEVLEAIEERRATRAYLDEPVKEATLRALLDAAVRAPSARNEQPWSFAVVQDRSFLDRLSQAVKERLGADPEWRAHLPLDDPDFDIFYGAPALVVICARRDGFEPAGDCYLAGENLMLAAVAMGLATCPIGLARDELRSEAMRRELAIPPGVDPILPIVIGYSDATVPRTERRPPVVHAWLRRSP